jgi:putative ABC transport system permease protein
MSAEWLSKLRLRMRALWKRKQLDRDLDDELAFHLAMREEKNRAATAGDEARYVARRQFGNITQMHDRTREQWTFSSLEALWQDIRFAVRGLRKDPGFTAIAAITLALGIGANTAIFSIVNGLILRPLSVHDPNHLAYLAFPRGGNDFDIVFSYSEFAEIRAQTAALFSDHAAMLYGGWAGFENSTGDGLTVDGRTEAVQTVFVTGNFFTLLGLTPSQGRLILPSEGAAAGADPVVVLGYRYWKDRFREDPAIVGKKAAVNGRDVTIVGIAPKNFDGISPLVTMQAYLPLGMATVDSGGDTSFLTDPKSRNLFIMTRLNVGVRTDKAQPTLSVVGQRLFQHSPRTGELSTLRAIPLRPPGVTGHPDVLSKLASLFLLLPALVLLLASVNVANLLLVRASTREREMAVRAALGASRVRLVRQLLTESILLSLLGGFAGVVLGLNASHAAGALPLETDLPIVVNFSFDWRVFTYGFGAALATGILVGVFPALRISAGNLRDTLHASGRTSTGARQRLRSVLVAVQVGGSLALLVVAGLFLRSFQSTRNADLGFDPRNVLNLTTDPHEIGYDKKQGIAFQKELLARVRALPGVESASIASAVPCGETVSGDDISIPGFQLTPGQLVPHPIFSAISTSYFQTMRIALLRGRDFSEADDENAPKVAVINEAMASRYWPNQDPVGKHFTRNADPTHPIEIVGVVRNTRIEDLFGPFEEAFYVPHMQSYSSSETLQLRTAADPEALSPEVLAIVRSIAPTMPVSGVRTMERALRGVNGLLLFEFAAGLAGALGALGLGLAVVGVYGVMSYAVSRRTSEIGIRMALGAEPNQILAMICRQGLILIASGLLVGLLAAFAVGHLVSDFLAGVSPNDPITYVGVSVLLAVIALLASYIPAYRAMRIEPMVALRQE